jgi:hypothetical protein
LLPNRVLSTSAGTASGQQYGAVGLLGRLLSCLSRCCLLLLDPG